MPPWGEEMGPHRLIGHRRTSSSLGSPTLQMDWETNTCNLLMIHLRILPELGARRYGWGRLGLPEAESHGGWD
ncbi:hypothetical protein L484_005817 [Morus notabilis]|uniref:Uncharacterized protein n=1 Tax=Morus notabilis TaxID=981085 RepID=W9RNN2_9ROSA|nr:hypothetical protein L484_005817 [Morus notabilis]